MATYKVIQDIEAEDKILGPLSLRQFIYAGIASIFLYLCYFVATHGVPFLVAAFLPVALVTGFFAFPWGRDQPTEIWALAKIRFMLKPRKRTWDQSGATELVTITAPKKIEQSVEQMSQTEVRSRLQALANTIDTRGWAIKSATGAYSPASFAMQQQGTSDRLLDVNSMPQQQPFIASDVQASDDILDEQANPRARQVDTLISQSTQEHRQKIIDQLRLSTQQQPQQAPANYWFLNQPAQPTQAPPGSVTFNTQVVAPGTPVSADEPTVSPTEEAALVHELEAKKQEGPSPSYYGHLHTIQPLSEQKKQASSTPQPTPQSAPSQPPAQPLQPPKQPVTPSQQAAILQLANNDDLNVATIAREANRAESNGEVVINLH